MGDSSVTHAAPVPESWTPLREDDVPAGFVHDTLTRVRGAAARHGVTRRKAGAGACAIGILLAGGVAWYWQQPLHHGPLDGSDDFGVFVDAFPAGAMVTYGFVGLTNDGDAEITIEHVEPLPGEPGPEIVEQVYGAGPERLDYPRRPAMFDVEAGWPWPDGEPIEGMTVRPGGGLGVELLIGVRVPSAEEGARSVAGVRVTYRAGGRHYVETYRSDLVLCPSGHAGLCAEAAKSWGFTL